MAKELRCGELMEGCPYVARAENEEELMKKVSAHAAEAHGIHEITPELAAQVRSRVQTT